ncbi:hypothetical protein AAVH_07954 [Aphelenchoides avenae]|nr:hypothetical protein AAVH_07954 [Aphelenchus avenae]
MSAAEETLPCLLCKERHPKEYFLYYIHTHFKYAQHSCANCNFKSVSADAMETHAAEKRHQAQLHSDRSEYMDRVCQIVLEDTQYAAVHGVGALNECSVKRPRGMVGNQNSNTPGTSGQSADRAVLNQQSVAAVRPAERKRLSVETVGMPSSSSKKSRPESPEPVLPDTTNDDVEIIEVARAAIPRDSSIKQSQSTQNAGAASGNAAQRRATVADIIEKLERMISRNQPEMECSKCGVKVPNNFLARCDHVRKRHSPEGSVVDAHAHRACFPDATAFTALDVIKLASPCLNQ